MDNKWLTVPGMQEMAGDGGVALRNGSKENARMKKAG